MRTIVLAMLGFVLLVVYVCVDIYTLAFIEEPERENIVETATIDMELKNAC